MAGTPGERFPHGRTFHHSSFTRERIAAERRRSVSVCLPARECADTVGAIVERLLGLREAGVLDEVVVVDAASLDGTAARAAAAGATVHQEAELLPRLGPVLGKGDALWRALSVLDGDVVCFLDADTEDFSEHFATGLIGAVCCEPEVEFAKAFYRRPGPAQDGSEADGGGRVNRLMARPLMAEFFPELGWIRQPLAGEVAAPRELLERLPFATGYGLEIGMLIDVFRQVGSEGIVQVDLDVHRHPHQSLDALEPMARTVLGTVAGRLHVEGRLTAAAAGAPLERPPLASLALV
ncbi:MAG TPA: glucosyl-3-phosphoglycerate synthase [Solirubrobacteraceae bacterium]|nr:glucosyl-3-phosphoglycerate synthase [Solirubrobacteraceae bacterium]